MPASRYAPKQTDLGATWKFLEEGIDSIMNNLDQGMTMQIYMTIYSSIHNFCTAHQVTGTQLGIAQGSSRGAHLLGEELYKKLGVYLRVHLEALVEHCKPFTDEALLKYFITEWSRYTAAAKYIHHLFRYLNRHWVKREMDEGKKTVHDVYTLHLVQWHRVMFEATHSKVMDAVLALVERHRMGETIEYTQIKQVVESFVALGLDDADSSKTTLVVYRHYFEKPFIKATRAFYQAESKQFVAQNTVVEYMAKAEARLAEEEERVSTYLHPDIAGTLRTCCNEVLISEHATVLRDEFQTLLENDRDDDMARMYRLLARIPDGLDPLRTRFETHVRKAGLAAVEKVAADADKLEPKTYVDALLAIHTKYQSLVKRAFKDEPEFTRSLDNACREFVNRNDVCKSSSNRSPELLAKYTDVLLRKGAAGIEEAELEQTLVHIMTIFKYIEDKDVFQKFYSRLLARRLVNSSSSSDDVETSMIGKLKEACGFEYTNKLQRMFQDMQISKDLNESFRKHLADTEPATATLESSYMILGTNFWPLSPPATAFIPPSEIQTDIELFYRFYRTSHDGRKLTWLWHLCKGELKVGFTGSKTYFLLVSAFQMAVLLLYNDKTSYTWEDLAQATSLSDEQLEGALVNLVKSKLLLVPGADSPKPAPGKTFALNADFKSKKVRIPLNTNTVKETKAEEAETNKTIEEDRKILIQSAMVRIMKARKKMKHAQLVSETIAQIKGRFIPKVTDIKKCVDILLDKEYIERLEDDDIGYLA